MTNKDLANGVKFLDCFPKWNLDFATLATNIFFFLKLSDEVVKVIVLLLFISSIRNAKILIISMNGVGAEVAKNIILSGVKAVTFMDDAVASEEDSFSQFLIPCDKIGSNVSTIDF